MSLRSLRYGETPPTSEPHRYPDARGYIRLRWTVAPGEVVEVYEHRMLAGAEPGEHVHHINEVKDDNRIKNLCILTPAEHTRYHGTKIDEAEAIRLYESGLSTIEVGRRVGHDSTVVYRCLDRNGVRVRSISEALTQDLPSEDIGYLHTNGVSTRRIAQVLGVSPTAVTRRIKEMGLPMHRTGRQSSEAVAHADAVVARYLKESA